MYHCETSLLFSVTPQIFHWQGIKMGTHYRKYQGGLETLLLRRRRQERSKTNSWMIHGVFLFWVNTFQLISLKMGLIFALMSERVAAAAETLQKTSGAIVTGKSLYLPQINRAKHMKSTKQTPPTCPEQEGLIPPFFPHSPTEDVTGPSLSKPSSTNEWGLKLKRPGSLPEGCICLFKLFPPT